MITKSEIAERIILLLVMYGQDPWLVIRISDGLRPVGETGVSSIILHALHPLLTVTPAGN